MRKTDAEWLTFQAVAGAAIMAVIGGVALLFLADLHGIAGILAAIAGLSLIAAALLGFGSFLRGDWDSE